MKYGSLEYRYAEPIARAMATNKEFSKWVLSRSKFAEFSDARLLKDEMIQKRQNPTAEWWRFHFFMGCKELCCSGGRETDIFVVYEAENNRRFAMHFEVKQPTDKFEPRRMQGQRYALRAKCWCDKAPPKILKHQDASLGIFFSEASRSNFEPVLSYFPTQITFEEIEQAFPEVAEWKGSVNGEQADRR